VRREWQKAIQANRGECLNVATYEPNPPQSQTTGGCLILSDKNHFKWERSNLLHRTFRSVRESLIAPLANLAISAAIALALLAELLLVKARLPQFPTFAPAAAVDRPAMVVARVTRIYSDAARPKLNTL
jgi:hypothetical protein